MERDSPRPVTLDNCASEPIHIPGSIQPHGVLLAFDASSRLTQFSVNAAALLGVTPEFGNLWSDLGLAPYSELDEKMGAALTSLGQERFVPESVKWSTGDRTFDVVIHALPDCVICEFELRATADEEIDRFSQKAYRAMAQLKGQRTVERLLDAAVAEVQAITGFDRVMAYRFRHDDSGEVVAERCRNDLDPYPDQWGFLASIQPMAAHDIASPPSCGPRVMSIRWTSPSSMTKTRPGRGSAKVRRRRS